MKSITELAIYLITGLILAVAGVLLGAFVLFAILTAVGNLAFWPDLVAIMFGQPLSLNEALVAGSIVLTLVLYAPRFLSAERQERLASLLGTGIIGLLYLLFLGAIGVPAFMILKSVFDIDASAWLLVPLGAMSLLSFVLFSNRFAKKRKP